MAGRVRAARVRCGMKLENTKMAFDALDWATACSRRQKVEKLTTEVKELTQRFLTNNSEYSMSLDESTKAEKEQNASLLLALTEIARTVNAKATLDELLLTIAKQTKKVLNADRCTVFLYDKEKNELWSKIALGLGSEEIRFSADKGFERRHARRRRGDW